MRTWGSGRRVVRSAVLAAALSYTILQWLGRTSGATRRERSAKLPGDEVVRFPQVVVTHAATLPAPPEAVWPWLAQVGWGRAGWYTPRWVDRLFFPANRPSAGTLLQDHASLSVGDWVPDGPPETECGFTVYDVEPARHLVLHSTSHLPLTWRRRGVAGVDWSWAFVLSPADGEAGTRLVFRWRSRTTPAWLTAGVQALVVPADALMSTGMLRGLVARASGAEVGHAHRD